MAETYDPVADVWEEAGETAEVRSNHAVSVLADGRVLVVGGGKLDGPHLKAAELWNPATGTWSAAGTMAVSRAFHSATLLLDGRVLIVGGKGKKTSAELYDPETGTWSSAGDTTDPRSEHQAVLLSDGRLPTRWPRRATASLRSAWQRAKSS
jgi:hypothetical protein